MSCEHKKINIIYGKDSFKVKRVVCSNCGEEVHKEMKGKHWVR
jgi:ribosomal protein L37E